MPDPIHIFRPGRHTAMSGQALEFSEDDVRRMAAAYDPKLHEAPLVVGHPRTDAPAYGWVQRLEDKDGLRAHPHQVDPQFAELVRKGAYKKVSASFYPPGHPRNPAGDDAYYLRHVGFLGGMAPAIKGLDPVDLGEADDDVVTVEFGEMADRATATLWQRMREFFIEKFGREEADRTLPDYLVGETEPGEGDELSTYSEDAGVEPVDTPTTETEGDAMDKQELERRQAELAEREQVLADREARIKAEEAERTKRAVSDWAEAQVAAGRVLPAEKDGLVELAASLDDEDQALSFGEGDAAEQVSTRAFLQRLIEAVPERVDYSERAGDDRSATGGGHASSRLNLPAGYAANPDEVALAQKALAYAEEHGVEFIQAVQAVSQ